jgi:methyl-accepting chemotaxis protein
VRQRLFLGFGAVLLILLGVTLLAVVKVTRIDDALRANAEMHGALQRFAINFRGQAHDQAIAVRAVVLAGDAARRGRAQATQAQRQGIGEVDQAVALLDDTTQHNAALVAQSASASGTLHEQASDLASTVQVFRLAVA